MANVKRDARGRLLPGSVNNPRGRPPTGIAFHELARDLMGQHDGARTRAMFDMVFRVAMGWPIYKDVAYMRRCEQAIDAGQPVPPPPDSGEVVVPTPEQQADAREFLAKWAFQRLPERTDVTSGEEPVSAGAGILADASPETRRMAFDVYKRLQSGE